VIVRAHQEEQSIARVCGPLVDAGFDVTVALSGSTDRTGERAASAGAGTVVVPVGLGAATVAALRHAAGHPVVFVDGDLVDVSVPVVELLWEAASRGFVGKGILDRPGRSSAALPSSAEQCGVELPALVPVQGLTSSYASYPADVLDRVDVSMIPADRGSDLMLSLLVADAGYLTVCVPAGRRLHADRGEEHVARLRASNLVTLQTWASRAEPAR
jgi:glycosyltransferase involved in cell wall biosynthesis